MTEYSIRPARESDANEILDIYAPYIEKTAITFECRVPDPDSFRRRIRDIAKDYPYLVCLLDDRIVGYAYAHRQMERAAYGWNAELSVYLSPDHQRNGIGRALYTALIEILELQNIRNLYAGITLPNPKSQGLHRALGFRDLGVYHLTGYKFGSWRDVVWMEKRIGTDEELPKPFLPIHRLDWEIVAGILKRCEERLNTFK